MARFYALCCRCKRETSPYVLNGMLNAFSIDVYVFLDPGSTLSFVTLLVSTKFDILPDILNEPFMMSTSG